MLLSAGRISCLGLHCYAADGQLGNQLFAWACAPPDSLTSDLPLDLIIFLCKCRLISKMHNFELVLSKVPTSLLTF